MILDGLLAATGDEDEFLDAGGPGLFHRILDQRLVDDRQLLLRHRLGRRQKPGAEATDGENGRSEEHTSELQSLMRISYAVFCLKTKKIKQTDHTRNTT